MVPMFVMVNNGLFRLFKFYLPEIENTRINKSFVEFRYSHSIVPGGLLVVS